MNEHFVVRGSGPLSGAVDVVGAKNSVLKLRAAALLAEGRTILGRITGYTTPWRKAIVKMLPYLVALFVCMKMTLRDALGNVVPGWDNRVVTPDLFVEHRIAKGADLVAGELKPCRVESLEVALLPSLETRARMQNGDQRRLQRVDVVPPSEALVAHDRDLPAGPRQLRAHQSVLARRHRVSRGRSFRGVLHSHVRPCEGLQGASHRQGSHPRDLFRSRPHARSRSSPPSRRRRDGRARRSGEAG